MLRGMSESGRLSHVLARSSDPAGPGAERLEEIIRDTVRVAVVGMSRDPSKAARRVPSYMAAKGYELIPINPHAERILGKEALPSLDHLEEPVDLVLVFRPSRDAADVIRAAAARPEQPVIWLQEGIRADEAANAARALGLTVVQDLCFYKAHRALTEDEMRSVAPGSPADA